jgi:hypothetical protein
MFCQVSRSHPKGVCFWCVSSFNNKTIPFSMIRDSSGKKKFPVGAGITAQMLVILSYRSLVFTTAWRKRVKCWVLTNDICVVTVTLYL